MKTYRVKSPVKSGGKLHPIDSLIELSDEHAARALAKGSVELHDPRAQAEAMNDAIQAAAGLVASGLLTIDQAVEQITAQVQGTVAAQVRAAIQDSADAQLQRTADEEARKRKEQEEAEARQAAEESAARQRAEQERRPDTKVDKKKK